MAVENEGQNGTAFNAEDAENAEGGECDFCPPTAGKIAECGVNDGRSGGEQGSRGTAEQEKEEVRRFKPARQILAGGVQACPPNPGRQGSALLWIDLRPGLDIRWMGADKPAQEASG